MIARFSSLMQRTLTRLRQRVQRAGSIRVPLPTAAASLFLGVAVLRHFLLHSFELLNFSAVFIAVALLLPEALAQSLGRPAFAALVFVRRVWVVLAVVSLNLIFAAILAFWYQPWGDPSFSRTMAAQFTLQGVLVGGGIRGLFVVYLRKVLSGVETEWVAATLLGMVGIHLWLFPVSNHHQSLAVPYLVGIALGFLAHFLIRGAGQRSARRKRFRAQVEEFLGGPDCPRLQQRELMAIQLFVQARFIELRVHLKMQEVRITTPLVVIAVLMEHALGNYDRAEKLVDVELQRKGHSVELETYLYLLKALNIAERGGNTESMFAAIDEGLRRNPECLLCKLFWALRSAELATGQSAEARRALARAFRYATEAVREASRRPRDLWASLVGGAIPMTLTFLQDAAAYVDFKCGDQLKSKAVFENCMQHDPKFSSPYLHLGELYVMNALASHDEERANRYRKLARISLHIAINLEHGRDSLTKRRAEILLRKTYDKGCRPGDSPSPANEGTQAGSVASPHRRAGISHPPLARPRSQSRRQRKSRLRRVAKN